MGYLRKACGDTVFDPIKEVMVDEIIIAYAKIAYVINSNTLSDSSKLALINAYIEESKWKSPPWVKECSRKN